MVYKVCYVAQMVRAKVRGFKSHHSRKELDMLAWPQKYIIKSSNKNYQQSSFVKTYCMEEPIGFSFRDCLIAM